jgi:hypothetical protein
MSIYTNLYIDSYISFLIFAILLSVITIYYLFDLELESIINNLLKSLKIYINDNDLSLIVNSSYFINNYKNTEIQAHITHDNNKSDMTYYYRVQTIIIVCIIIGFLILGIILYIYNYGFTMEYLDIKELSILFIINVCIITFVEVLMFVVIMPKYQFIEIRKILQLFIGLPV